MSNDLKVKCRFFAQGRCAFGDKCKFSHSGFQQIYLLRHAQSVFNAFSDQLQGVDFCSQQAKQIFQLNQQLIDCGLTEKGIQQASKVQLPGDCFTLKKRKKDNQTQNIKVIDIVFISPLNRALETAHIILKKNHIRARKILVLPQLSEVLSKVCDFCLGTEDKKQKYDKFDFEEVDKLNKLFKGKGCFWQDSLLDKQHQPHILDERQHGGRYMKILDAIFPTPLQNSQNCFNRAMLALRKIQKVAKQQNANKILIVSHNRILKYIVGRNNSGRAPSFQNCELRKILIQEI